MKNILLTVLINIFYNSFYGKSARLVQRSNPQKISVIADNSGGRIGIYVAFGCLTLAVIGVGLWMKKRTDELRVQVADLVAKQKIGEFIFGKGITPFDLDSFKAALSVTGNNTVVCLPVSVGNSFRTINGSKGKYVEVTNKNLINFIRIKAVSKFINDDASIFVLVQVDEHNRLVFDINTADFSNQIVPV